MQPIWTTVLTSLGTAFVAVVGTIIVGGFDYFNKDKELDIKLVNVGLSILRGEATGDQDSIYARKFALRLLKKYGDVEIPDKEFDAWASKGSVPFKKTQISLISRALGSQIDASTLQSQVIDERITKLNKEIKIQTNSIEEILEKLETKQSIHKLDPPKKTVYPPIPRN